MKSQEPYGLLRLPQELLELIFRHLDEGAFYRLCLTCKWTNPTATALLYETILLKSLRGYERLSWTLNNRPALQQIPRTIMLALIYRDLDSELSKHHQSIPVFTSGFSAVCNLPCPNLRVIKVGDSPNLGCKDEGHVFQKAELTRAAIINATDSSSQVLRSLDECELTGGGWYELSNELGIIHHRGLKKLILSNLIVDKVLDTEVSRTTEQFEPLSLCLTRCIFTTEALEHMLSIRSNAHALYLTAYISRQVDEKEAKDRQIYYACDYQRALEPIAKSLLTLSICETRKICQKINLDLTGFHHLENLRMSPKWLSCYDCHDRDIADLAQNLPPTLRLLALDPVNLELKINGTIGMNLMAISSDDLYVVEEILTDRVSLPNLKLLCLCNTEQGDWGALDPTFELYGVMRSSLVDLKIKPSVGMFQGESPLLRDRWNNELLDEAQEWFEELVEDLKRQC